MAKVVVGMSGGVDSAVSAYLLKKEGHEVIGVFMRNWDSVANNDLLGNPNADASVCPEELDWDDVLKLGKQLGIPVMRVDFVKEYWQSVFQNLIEEYGHGRTPNPDILCNRYIKFGAFYKWIEKNIPNVDFIATGHYAKIERGNLVKPLDHTKDQTYFLAQVFPEQLKKTYFPLGNIRKSEVRKIATEQNLIVAAKPDSTGICFIGERDFTNFLQNYIPAQPGEIIDITTNRVVGKHVGAMYYTIGKRSGIGLSGMNEPYYVCGHNLDKRIIYVAPQSQPEYLLSDEAIIDDVNWLVHNKHEQDEIEVQFRYRSESVRCRITWTSPKQIRVSYPQAFFAVTPGQQAVFYHNNICLGGGVISKVFLKGSEKTYVTG